MVESRRSEARRAGDLMPFRPCRPPIRAGSGRAMGASGRIRRGVDPAGRSGRRDRAVGADAQIAPRPVPVYMRCCARDHRKFLGAAGRERIVSTSSDEVGLPDPVWRTVAFSGLVGGFGSARGMQGGRLGRSHGSGPQAVPNQTNPSPGTTGILVRARARARLADLAEPHKHWRIRHEDKGGF